MREDVELTPAWFGHHCDFIDGKIVVMCRVFVNGDEGGMARTVRYELDENQAFLLLEAVATALRRKRNHEGTQIAHST